jgi:hypothetical protein
VGAARDGIVRYDRGYGGAVIRVDVLQISSHKTLEWCSYFCDQIITRSAVSQSGAGE